MEDELKEAMPASNGKISDLTLRANDKGYTLNYTVKVKKPGKPKFDDYRHEYKTESFSDDDYELAFAKFKTLAGTK